MKCGNQNYIECVRQALQISSDVYIEKRKDSQGSCWFGWDLFVKKTGRVKTLDFDTLMKSSDALICLS